MSNAFGAITKRTWQMDHSVIWRWKQIHYTCTTANSQLTTGDAPSMLTPSQEEPRRADATRRACRVFLRNKREYRSCLDYGRASSAAARPARDGGHRDWRRDASVLPAAWSAARRHHSKT